MGKGLAYRFKQHYPLNNEYYEYSCKHGQVRVGHILFFEEGGKTIANFPTKNRWRDDSRYEYIEAGLVDLCAQISRRTISSVALPPLGCGNGGLEWSRVKPIIEQHMSSLDVHVYLHTPLNALPDKVTAMDYKLAAPHLVLMMIKDRLSPFSRSRLKAAALLSQMLCAKSPFDFAGGSTQDFENHIDTLCLQIRSFQQNSGVDSKQVQQILIGNLASITLDAALSKCSSAVDKATCLVNSLATERDLDVAAAVVCTAKKSPDATANEIARLFCPRFAVSEMHEMITHLEQAGILERTLLGLRTATA